MEKVKKPDGMTTKEFLQIFGRGVINIASQRMFMAKESLRITKTSCKTKKKQPKE